MVGGRHVGSIARVSDADQGSGPWGARESGSKEQAKESGSHPVDKEET